MWLLTQLSSINIAVTQHDGLPDDWFFNTPPDAMFKL